MSWLVAFFSCLVSLIDDSTTITEWKDALRVRFYTGAPRQLRSRVERYSIAKRALPEWMSELMDV